MAHKKIFLEVKICPVCERPFSWRKKWAKDWQHVKYCSKRCQANKSQSNPPQTYIQAT